MDYSYYTGVTAYLKKNHKNEARLRLLAEAIPALRPHVDMLQIIPLNYTDLWMSDKFSELYEFGHLVRTPGYHDHQFPIDTPEAYQSVSIADSTIKSDELTRLYLPMLAFNKSDITYTVDYLLYPLLDQLFGNDIVCMKVRGIDESGRFDEAQDCVYISTDDQETCTA